MIKIFNSHNSDVILAIFVVLVAAMLLIPLPPFLLDVLLAFNISFSILLRHALPYYSTNCFKVVFELTYPLKKAFILSPAQKLFLTKDGTQLYLASYKLLSH